jgi:hypothetical protein
MQLEEIKTAIKALPVEERRKIAVYILELEKDHFTEKVGPQIADDLEGVAKVIQDTAERIKQRIKEKL